MKLATSGLRLEPAAQSYADKHGFAYVPCVTGDFGKVLPFTVARALEMLDPWGPQCRVPLGRDGHYDWSKYDGRLIWDIEGSETLGRDLLEPLTQCQAQAGKLRTQSIKLFKDVVSIGEQVAPTADHGAYGTTARGLGSHYNANEHFDFARTHAMVAGWNSSELFRDAQFSINCIALYLPADEPLDRQHEFVLSQVKNGLNACLVKPPGKIKTVLFVNPYVTAVLKNGRASKDNLTKAIHTAVNATDDFGMGTQVDQVIAWDGTKQLVTYEGLPPEEWPSSRIEADQLELLEAIVAAV